MLQLNYLTLEPVKPVIFVQIAFPSLSRNVCPSSKQSLGVGGAGCERVADDN